MKLTRSDIAMLAVFAGYEVTVLPDKKWLHLQLEHKKFKPTIVDKVLVGYTGKIWTDNICDKFKFKPGSIVTVCLYEAYEDKYGKEAFNDILVKSMTDAGLYGVARWPICMAFLGNGYVHDAMIKRIRKQLSLDLKKARAENS